MPDYNYFKIDSWHIVDTITRGSGVIALCGKSLGPGLAANVKDNYPPNQKSCESCLRLATAEDDPKPEKEKKAKDDPEAADPAVTEEY